MLKNYLLIGWRNLVRTKVFSFVNIAGLSAGMAVAILIGIWVWDEISYNTSFRNYDRLAAVYHHVTFGDEVMTINDVPEPLGRALKDACADFEQVAMTSNERSHIVQYKESSLTETCMFVEPAFVTMFSMDILQGSAVALNDIHSVLMSQTLAASLVGDDPVGKSVKFDNRDHLVIAGVFRDFPANSEFAPVKMILPMAYYLSVNESKKDNWEDYTFVSYVLMRDHASFEDAESKMKDVLYQHASNDGKSIKPKGILFPMSRWHLYADFNDGINTGGQIRSVWMLGIIGVFVLMLACINFMNLSTARSEKRSKEIGVRKVMGSLRGQLVNQFLSESLLIVFISFLLSVLIAQLSLPWFNTLAGKNMSIPYGNPVFILSVVIFIIGTSLLAGSYPALYLSSFNPVKVLKGIFHAGRGTSVPRKVLVIFQFTTSIIIVIGTMVVYLQIQHAKNRPVGFDRKGIVHIAVRTEELAKTDYNILRDQLLATGVVQNMAVSDFPITGSMAADASLTWKGKDPALRPLVALNSCSHDFPATSGFQFIEGRDFSRELASDSFAVVINEMAAQLIAGGESALGKTIRFGYAKDREIVGVIKDQIRWTPFSKQSPHIYYIRYDLARYITVRLYPDANPHDALSKVEAAIKKIDAAAPFEYKFVDDDYARLFHSEERMGKLAAVFAVLAIFISCIGIFALAAFAASQRTKEIGIRKVLGASVFALWRMLAKDFLILVAAAILLASPLAYYLLQQWLQRYEYRIDIPFQVFIVTALFALTVTLLTISYQTLKAAWVNPVKSLKSE
ncbi:ABC transporter permease [Ohtaekwangia kribbensis]|uniref:ABC transporter permease n=1 Tax=Ohtaekwangia kribbensis TaxID=688913 RepID=A0ABW3K2N5_9BACT